MFGQTKTQLGLRLRLHEVLLVFLYLYPLRGLARHPAWCSPVRLCPSLCQPQCTSSFHSLIWLPNYTVLLGDREPVAQGRDLDACPTPSELRDLGQDAEHFLI